jgi:hypothetical protein
MIFIREWVDFGSKQGLTSVLIIWIVRLKLSVLYCTSENLTVADFLSIIQILWVYSIYHLVMKWCTDISCHLKKKEIAHFCTMRTLQTLELCDCWTTLNLDISVLVTDYAGWM